MAIYLACWAMHPDGPHGFDDLVNELHPAELELFVERLDDREAMERRPADAQAGQAELLAIVAEEEERLEEVLELHLERDEAVDAALLVRRQRGGRAAASVRGDVRPGAAAGAGGAEAAAPRRRGGCDRDRGARDQGRRRAGRSEEDAGDRAAVLARLLSSMAGDRERDERSQRPRVWPGCADPAPCEMEVLPDATNEANTPAGSDRTAGRRAGRDGREAVTNEANGASGTTDDGRESVTNEANGPSRATDNGQPTTDNRCSRPCSRCSSSPESPRPSGPRWT